MTDALDLDKARPHSPCADDSRVGGVGDGYVFNLTVF